MMRVRLKLKHFQKKCFSEASSISWIDKEHVQWLIA